LGRKAGWPIITETLGNNPPVVMGMDIAHFDGNLIHSLFVFLEPNDA